MTRRYNIAARLASVLSISLLGVWGLASAELKTAGGFSVPKPGYEFSFPMDHGSHPDFKIEWWYVVGHLKTDSGRRLGYQATFFRSAGPLGDPSDESSMEDSVNFGGGQLFLAHMALIDVESGRFYHQERLNREGWDAFARTGSLDIRNGNWTLKSDGDSQAMNLVGGVRSDVSFELELLPAKQHVVFGQNGVSRKGDDPTAASYYITFTRLRTSGTVTIEGREYPATGQSWMDHEISSSQLGPDQTGWDWACLQLDDNREIMVYRMRRKDGSTDPWSVLAWVDARGEVTYANTTEFNWKALRWWQSPHTDIRYPIEALIETIDPETGRQVAFALKPLADDQEHLGRLSGVQYWEGACEIIDSGGRRRGMAYLELAGYAKPLTQWLK